MLAHRLERHHLARRASHEQRAAVVSDMCGVQAQVQSLGELSLWTRAEGVTAGVVRADIWESRTLVKCWAMRGTLHFLAAGDFALYKAALRERSPSNFRLWLKAAGLTPQDVEDLNAAVVAAIGDGALSRKELARIVNQPLLEGSWGGLLKPASSAGLICFGPMRGPETTFVRVDRWLGPQPHWENKPAREELLLRYLRAYGPATVGDFVHWAGAALAWGREAWRAALPEMAEVEVAGRRAWLPAEDLEALQSAPASSNVKLLSGFDVWLMGHADRELLLDRQFAAKVSRTAGWISQVVLLGGRVVGVWTHKQGQRAVSVSVELFEPLKAAARKQLEGEVIGLESFFGVPCAIIEVR